MTDEIILYQLKCALNDVNDNVVKFNSIQDNLKRNSLLIANLVCDLSMIHEDLKHCDLDTRIPEIEKINNQIRVLAEARAYMTRFEKIAQENEN